MIALSSLLVLAALTAADSTQPPNRIQLESPWVRLLPPSSEVTAAFVTLRNDTDQPDTLLSASSDAAETTELHVMAEADGQMTMRKVDFLVVPPRGVLELVPGGTHIMLIGLTGPLSTETPVRIDLRFSREGLVPLVAPVVDLRRSASRKS
ncbi:MAG: copper chaperone PCu(A)C [Candidatus Eisenbacteria bacterium]|nr:copper chaperone PCu(A)C [Candidatus Eisenbacteria bacterium]MCC7143528.1 copper chaperone PCu(A)C [Candidatus Eisenbacteria bacterium]